MEQQKVHYAFIAIPTMKHQYIFCECNSTKYLWLQLNSQFHCYLTFPALTPKSVVLSLRNDSVQNVRLVNHILLLSKLYIYISQNKHRLIINALLANILNIKKLEQISAFNNVKKVANYDQKWDITNKKRQL